jgi:PAS domain S-box-containing protein
MVAIVLLTVAAVGILTYSSVATAILPGELNRVETHAWFLSAQLESYVRGARADVLVFRSAVALDGIIRASLAGGTDPRDGTSEAQWRDRLASRFENELAVKPSYLRLRVIGIADGGREIVRVDRDLVDGTVRRVGDSELQQRGDLDYFKQTIGLPADAIHVSAIERNQENSNGVVETMPLPVLGVATPIFAPGGRPFGILIANIDMRPAFALIRSAANDGREVYLVNDRGEYLIHFDPGREFAFEAGRSLRWQQDFPGLADALKGASSGARVVTTSGGARVGAALATVQLADGPRVAVLERVPYEQLTAPAIAVQHSSLIAGLAAVLGAVGLAGLLSNSMTRPLNAMTAAAENFTRGKPARVPTHAAGEIGILARAFAHMVADIREKTAALTHSAEALRDSEHMARGIIDSAPDAFVQLDESGRILDWNPQAEKIFGWPREEVIGKVLADVVVPAEHRERHRQGILRYLQTGGSKILGQRFEAEALRKDGRVIKVELSATAQRRRGAVIFNGFIRDLTEKLTAEEQLRQSQKMDAIGQLTGGVAHDFNNILTVITGTIEILAEAVAHDPALAQITKMIDDAADRGAELTRHLLAFARRQPLQPRRTDVNRLLVDAANLLRPTLGEHIEIQSMFEGDLWPALVDSNQLTTAIVNLALNARDAMSKGGKLTLETGNVHLDERYAQTHGEIEPGAYVMIAVSDTGHGIPAAIRDKVFEPFFTTKDPGKGTGLGLSMVYGFVKQSNGHIKIYSEEGHGTTVKIYLPRAAEVADAAAEATPKPPIIGGNETILIVEDDPLVRNYVAAQLRSLGYATLAAGGAAEALQLVDKGAKFDLLFTDVIMPGTMNGRQLAEETLKRRPRVGILFTSGYTENAIVHHGRLDPGVFLLAKPYRKSDLACMIRTALDHPPGALRRSSEDERRTPVISA